MTICAYSGCKKSFISKRKDKRFCDANCKAKDNQLKRMMIPLALVNVFEQYDYVLAFEKAERLVERIDTARLSQWLFDYGHLTWLDSRWKLCDN